MNRVTRFIQSQQRTRHAVYQTDDRIRRSILRIGSLLAVFIGVHVLAMMWLEQMTLWPAIWLTMTTLMTVGYGDLSAQSIEGQAATLVLIYICGITLLTFLISDYVDYRIARKERIRSGHWNWNMADHILIINAPKHNRDAYFSRLIGQIRETDAFADTPIMLLNEEFHEGLPEHIRQLGVVHVSGLASRPEDLDRVQLDDAKHIIVLSRNEYSSDSDSYSFDIAHRLYSRRVSHKVIMECVDDANRARLSELGVSIMLRPTRSYPEIIVRAMSAPGSEQLIEDMFTHANDHTVRFPVQLKGKRWADVVSAVVQSNIGTPLAYVSEDNEVIKHPQADHKAFGSHLIVLVHTESSPENAQISLIDQCLSAL